MFRTVFPDLHITAEDIIAEGDTVMVRVTFSGTHQGEFAGLPPSGKQVTATEIDIVRIEDGKMVERWAEWDALGFLTQMGAIPPLEEVAALQEENRMLREVVGPPPASLADLYPPKSPAPVFWLGMLEMDQAATAMLVDLQQGDAEGAVANWEKFEQKYEELSQMVPEWSDRFPAEPLAAVREAVKAGDVPGIFAAFGPLGAACGGCHAANYLDTQFKYWWPDFGQVMVDDPMTQEAVPFGEFMFTVSSLFTGIGNDLAQGQLDNARQNYQGFKAAFGVMAEACDECHDTPREYFVDARVQADIDALGEALQATPPDGEAIGGLFQKIGEGSCGGCHMVHFPAALAKERWELVK